MHFPPGSNNRLNGAGENVANNARLSDSQNNDKCGYNVGDKYDDNPGDNISENRQEPMVRHTDNMCIMSKVLKD
ncbi:unnamed protein product [Pocillopora meandrina]|uniref:Uncharacterized protein n=1 Tax=Pocillopora meandrina TaxID=46732 RepID=A0AAU9WSW6_9CNID|nr:unnamed protein product [Pocillopora meandrina]